MKKIEFLKGGKGDYKSNKMFNPNELKKGIKIEHEHTTSKRVATEIAKDHLSEYPNYYTELTKMENRLNKMLRKRK